MILVIDNYDSFTFNIVQYLGELGAEVVTRRNDEITDEEIRSMQPKGILISPGPKRPEDTETSNRIIRNFQGQLPILGVCLGEQCMAYVHGGRIVRAERLMHGKTSPVHHRGQGVFRGIESPFPATRYHSLIVDRDSLPDDLVVTAWTEEGEVMGLEHVSLPLWGVQFHPESILTDAGYTLLRNFLVLCGEVEGAPEDAK